LLSVLAVAVVALMVRNRGLAVGLVVLCTAQHS
jgi:hypothetical protein